MKFRSTLWTGFIVGSFFSWVAALSVSQSPPMLIAAICYFLILPVSIWIAETLRH
jgi:hypothetical protein